MRVRLAVIDVRHGERPHVETDLVDGRHARERRRERTKKPGDPLCLGERQEQTRLGVAKDASLTSRVLLEAIGAERRVERYGHGAGEQHAEIRLEERDLGPQQQGYPIPGRNPPRREAGGDRGGIAPQRRIRDGTLAAVFFPQVDVHAIGRGFSMPSQHVDERAS